MNIKIFNLSKITSIYRANLILLTFGSLLQKKDNVLDLGCGTGIVSSYLEKNLGVKITGCDIKNYLIHPIPFKLMKKNNKLPFRNQTYDVVMLNDVLHHLGERNQFEILREALRVGKKVLIFEARPTLSGKLFDILLNILHYGDLNTPLTFKHEAGWIKIFKKLEANYEIIRVKSLFFYPFSHIAFSLRQIASKQDDA